MKIAEDMINIGSTLQLDAISSFTTNKDLAEGYAVRGWDQSKANIMLIVNSKTGKDVNVLVGGKQDEFFQRKGDIFKVIKVETVQWNGKPSGDPTFYKIYVDEVNGGK